MALANSLYTQGDGIPPRPTRESFGLPPRPTGGRKDSIVEDLPPRPTGGGGGGGGGDDMERESPAPPPKKKKTEIPSFSDISKIVRNDFKKAYGIDMDKDDDEDEDKDQDLEADKPKSKNHVPRLDLSSLCRSLHNSSTTAPCSVDPQRHPNASQLSRTLTCPSASMR